MVSNPLPDDTYRRRTNPRDYGVRGDYFRDQTAIIHSRPFRRLKHKTQVFFAPDNDHVCTRMEHVLHVATIAATICKGLMGKGWKVDPELAMAIGLGHDIGHAPFGHAGEATIARLLGGPTAFVHEVNGYRVVEHVANYGRGLNLTYAVKDGMICHNGETFERLIEPDPNEKDLEAIVDRKFRPSSYEGCIVRLSDKIAYLGRDIEDAIIAHLIDLSDVPEAIRVELGEKNGEIIDTLVEDVIAASSSEGWVCLSPERHELMLRLRDFNYECIYKHGRIQRYIRQAEHVIRTLFEHLSEIRERCGDDYEGYGASKLPLDVHFGRYCRMLEPVYAGAPPKRVVADYVAGMTDDFALEGMRQVSIPTPLEFAPNR